MVRERIRQLMPAIVARAPEYDRTGAFPRENLEALCEAGLSGMLVPRAMGGMDITLTVYGQAIAEVAAACPSTALCFNMHCWATGLIARYGTPEQQEQYLRPGRFFGIALSERRSDGYQIIAHTADKGFALTGKKSIVTGAGAVDALLVAAPLTHRDGSDAGFRLFLLPADDPAVIVHPTWDAAGMRGTHSNDVELRLCPVGPDGLLGDERSAPEAISYEGPPFVGVSAVSLGIAQAALQFAVTYCREHDKGSSLAVRRVLGEIAVDVDAAKLMLHRAAWLAQTKWPGSSAALRQAKYHCNLTALAATNKAMEACGGQAYLRRWALERHWRDARAGALMADTPEACLEQVGATLLKPDGLAETDWLS